MAQLHLTIVTPEGKLFDGPADRVLVRTTGGDVCILPKHIDYAASLGTGRAKVAVDGAAREADVSGGMIYVAQDDVRILTNSFDWRESRA